MCYAEGMTRFLYANGIQVFKYPDFAMTLRERVRERVASVVADAGVTVQHIAKSHIRKEAVVAKVLEQRGDRRTGWRPRIDYPRIRFVRFTGDSLTDGVVRHRIEGGEVPITR